MDWGAVVFIILAAVWVASVEMRFKAVSELFKITGRKLFDEEEL